MRIFLGVLMVLNVSGETTIQGNVGGSVLLPCTCLERNLNEDFLWQKEKPNETLVFKHNGTTSSFEAKYEGRAKIFLSENSDNCSILLSNITADDKGKYKCRFHIQDRYTYQEVNLNVSAIYDVCQTLDNLSESVKVFHCDVKGRYRDAEIQWKLDGKLLTNSTKTNITHTFNLDAPSGLYYFNSKLTTKLNSTSEPTCDVIVKTKDISANIHCSPRTEPTQAVRSIRHQYYIIIPIVLVLGLCLILRCHWDSKSLKSIQEVETDNSYC